MGLPELCVQRIQRIGDKWRRLMAEATPRVVVLDLEALFDLDFKALKMMADGERRPASAASCEAVSRQDRAR
jgi:hypothetical protein